MPNLDTHVGSVIATVPVEQFGLKAWKEIGYTFEVVLEASPHKDMFSLCFYRLDKVWARKVGEGRRTQNFIAFATQGDAIVVNGMHVRPLLRGKSDDEGVTPARLMFGFFVDYCRSLGFTKIKTAEINKPIVAKMLIQHGFSPVHEDVIVDLIDKDRKAPATLVVDYFSSRIEQVQAGNGRIVEGTPVPRNVSDNGKHEFYAIRKRHRALPDDYERGDYKTKRNYIPLQTTYALDGGIDSVAIPKEVRRRVGEILKKRPR